jgi:hypothetical protein
MTTVRWMVLARSRYATQVLAAVLAGSLIAVVVLLPRLQSAEVHLAAVVLAFVMFPDAHVPPGSDVVFFTLTDGQLIGVEISTQSAAALLALPLLLVSVAIAWLRPDDAGRAAASLLAAVGVLVIENQLRILWAAVLADNVLPQDRASISATVFGSMCTVLCLAVAVLLFVFAFTGMRHRAMVTLTGDPQ